MNLYQPVDVPLPPSIAADVVDTGTWTHAAKFAPILPLHSAKVAPFVRAGKALFTVRSVKTGNRFTFKVRIASKGRPPFPYFVSVGSGDAKYTYLGTLFADGSYRHGRRSPIQADAPEARAALWFFNNMDSPLAEVFHAGRCCRCARTLTDPASIARGIGPECAEAYPLV